MYKKLVSSILIVALLNLLGCYSIEYITTPEYKQIEEEDEADEIRVVTKDSQEYHFSGSNFSIENDTLNVRVKSTLTDVEQPYKGKFVLSDIKYIQFDSCSYLILPTLILIYYICTKVLIMPYRT